MQFWLVIMRRHLLPAGPKTRGSASLRFAGKVGTGFDTKMLAVLHKQFKKEERKDCPFADSPAVKARHGTESVRLADKAVNGCRASRPA